MKLIDSQKRLIIFILFLFISISYFQMLSDSSYFPLALSNEWNYNATIMSSNTRSVTDASRYSSGIYFYKMNLLAAEQRGI